MTTQYYEIKCLICHKAIVSPASHDICRECSKDFHNPDLSTAADYIASLQKILQDLTDHCTYMNNMQHAGQDMLPIDWSTLYDLQNKARLLLTGEAKSNDRT